MQGFAGLLVTAVVFLAPGVGLMTLTTPDGEPDATTILLADNSHAGKRAVDDTSQSFDTGSSKAKLPAIPALIQSALPFRSLSTSSQVISNFQIRAPPVFG